MKKAAKSENKDMDKIDRQQEKLNNTPSAVAFAFQEKMIVHFCEHYYEYLKGEVSAKEQEDPANPQEDPSNAQQNTKNLVFSNNPLTEKQKAKLFKRFLNKPFII